MEVNLKSIAFVRSYHSRRLSYAGVLKSKQALEENKRYGSAVEDRLCSSPSCSSPTHLHTSRSDHMPLLGPSTREFGIIPIPFPGIPLPKKAGIRMRSHPRVSEEILGEMLHVSGANDFRKVDGERVHTAEESKEDSGEISTSMVPCIPDELIGASSANDSRKENGVGDKETAIFSKAVSSNYQVDSCPNEEEANRSERKRRLKQQSLEEKAEKDKTVAISAFMAAQGNLTDDIQWGHRGSVPLRIL
ncbi:hypothetical protein Ancab_004565 [Ancistrocladus abbreviatus]